MGTAATITLICLAHAAKNATEIGDTAKTTIEFKLAINYSLAQHSNFSQADNSKDIQRELANYNRAIQLKPNDAISYHDRAFLKHTKFQDVRGALADYNRAIELDPKDTNAYSNRGFLKYTKLQDSQRALADYNRAIQLDPNYAIAYSNRGILKADKPQDSQGALADLNRAIQLDPNYATAYDWRSRLKYEKLNDRSGAIADMKQAAKLYQQQSNTKMYQQAIDYLGKMNGNQPSRTMETSPGGFRQDLCWRKIVRFSLDICQQF
jgi:tetratricopeptide (TPR) repeat protein